MYKELHQGRFLYLLAPKTLVSLALDFWSTLHPFIHTQLYEYHQILTQIKLHQPNCFHWGLNGSMTSQVHRWLWTKQHCGNVFWSLLHIIIVMFLHQILVSCHYFLTLFFVIFPPPLYPHSLSSRRAITISFYIMHISQYHPCPSILHTMMAGSYCICGFLQKWEVPSLPLTVFRFHPFKKMF